MPSSPPTDIYVVATSVMGALFVTCLVRVWMLNRTEEKLQRQREELEKQLRLRQQELATIRQDAQEWRTETQRQFDGFRKMANDQLSSGETRFATLQSQARQREYELLTALDLARQMCSELPHVQARVLHLESLLAPAATSPATQPSPFSVAAEAPASFPEEVGGAAHETNLSPSAGEVTPLPDLGGAHGWNGRYSGTPVGLL